MLTPIAGHYSVSTVNTRVPCQTAKIANIGRFSIYATRFPTDQLWTNMYPQEGLYGS